MAKWKKIGDVYGPEKDEGGGIVGVIIAAVVIAMLVASCAG